MSTSTWTVSMNRLLCRQSGGNAEMKADIEKTSITHQEEQCPSVQNRTITYLQSNDF